MLGFKWFKGKPADVVARATVLTAQKDDLVLVTVPANVTQQQMEAARDIFREALRGKGADVLVVTEGTNVSLVRQAAAQVEPELPL